MKTATTINPDNVPWSGAYGSLVSAQTGAILIVLGGILTHLSPIRQQVAPHTGALLVKIGRKLTGANFAVGEDA